uniref:Putative chaperonin n=1 Tax=viral metagenome TaxID=1070528 RepID=A0A6M3KP84_9ZZZZ
MTQNEFPECPYEANDTCIVIQEDKVEEVTKGGILLSKDQVNREQNSATEGTIVNLGCMAFYDIPEEHRFKVGDRVIYKKYSGVGRTYNDIPYRIMNDKDIAARERKHE